MSKPLNSLLILALTIGCLISLSCAPKTVSSEEKTGSAALVPTPTPVKATNDEALTIAAVGDIMLGSTSIDETFLPPNDGADILKEATPILSAADIAFGNLEGPLLEGGKTEKCPPASTRCFAFRSPTRYAKLL